MVAFQRLVAQSAERPTAVGSVPANGAPPQLPPALPLIASPMHVQPGSGFQFRSPFGLGGTSSSAGVSSVRSFGGQEGTALGNVVPSAYSSCPPPVPPPISGVGVQRGDSRPQEVFRAWVHPDNGELFYQNIGTGRVEWKLPDGQQCAISEDVAQQRREVLARIALQHKQWEQFQASMGNVVGVGQSQSGVAAGGTLPPSSSGLVSSTGPPASYGLSSAGGVACSEPLSAVNPGGEQQALFWGFRRIHPWLGSPMPPS